MPCSNGAATALADFLVAKDANANVLVVEDTTFNIRGLLAVNSAVDAAVLLQHFDLAAYDGLLNPQEYAELVSEAEAVIIAEQQASADAKAVAVMVRYTHPYRCSPQSESPLGSFAMTLHHPSSTATVNYWALYLEIPMCFSILLT